MVTDNYFGITVCDLKDNDEKKKTNKRIKKTVPSKVEAKSRVRTKTYIKLRKKVRD
jgi:hypothetical protein